MLSDWGNLAQSGNTAGDAGLKPGSLTWTVQVESSECPVNPGFHDNVTLFSSILNTDSSTGGEGSTEGGGHNQPESIGLFS